MKRYLIIILMTFLALSVLTVCVKQVSSANTPDDTLGFEEMPDSSFSKEDYQKLLALQFDGYEDMTVSEYQNHVAQMTDTAEYRDLLNRVSASEIMYGMKDTDEMSAFLYYVLEPLTGEKWKSRVYNGSTTSGFPYPEDNAVLEYDFTLTIRNADTLTIREYNTARISVINGMNDVLSNKTKEELQDTNTNLMLEAIQTDTDNLIRQLQTEDIGIAIEYAYFPLSEQNGNNGIEHTEYIEEKEQRRYPNGTEDDYRSLLALKTPDYQDMSITDFNNTLLEWANENHERMERIGIDTGMNDFQVILTTEELSFVKLTVFLSGMENGKYVQSCYTGCAEENPVYDEYLPQKTVEKDGAAAWCDLYYRFSYCISDKETVTVGERDHRIEGMINTVQAFWNDTDTESMLEMNKSDVVEELEKVAAMYSNDKVIITISEEQVHFECMDERGVLDYQ